MKSPATDVIYHRYPSKNLDAVEKAVPVAVAVDGADTDDEDDEVSSRLNCSPPLAPSPPGRFLSFCSRLGRLLTFHTLNGFLGLGGAVLVLVLVPLSVGLIPLFGVGISLFQLSAGVVEVLARADIRLANMLLRQEPKLRKAFGIQGGLSTNNGCTNCCQRLFFLSPKMILVMLYFATVKLVVGVLSIIAVWWGFVLPVEALTSGGHADAIGLVNYHNQPEAYVVVVLCGWALGVFCVVFVPNPSVRLTTWACAEQEDFDETPTRGSPHDSCHDLKNIQTSKREANAFV